MTWTDYTPNYSPLIHWSPNFQLYICQISFLKKRNLHSAFKESFKLAQLIASIPATTLSVERSFSALKRIHNYKRSTQSENHLSNLALLSIEKELLHELHQKNNFHDSVFYFKNSENRISIQVNGEFSEHFTLYVSMLFWTEQLFMVHLLK